MVLIMTGCRFASSADRRGSCHGARPVGCTGWRTGHSTVTSRNTAAHIRGTRRRCVTTQTNSRRCSEPIPAGNARGSNPVSSTHFHRRLSATEPVDDASAMRPLSDVGRAGRRALFARCPPRALPAYPAFHADHRRTGAARSTQDRRPTTPRRRSPSATSVPEPATRAAEL